MVGSLSKYLYKLLLQLMQINFNRDSTVVVQVLEDVIQLSFLLLRQGGGTPCQVDMVTSTSLPCMLSVKHQLKLTVNSKMVEIYHLEKNT